MDKVILLLVGVAIGVALILLLSGRQPVQPEQEISVEGAYVEILELFKVPEELEGTAGATMPHPSIEYLDASLNLLLHDLSPEINVAAGKVLPRPMIAYSDSSIPYAVLEEPPPDLFKAMLPKPFVSHPDAAVVFSLEQPLQELLSSAAQVRPRPLVEYPDAAWSGSLSPPSGLLEEGE